MVRLKKGNIQNVFLYLYWIQRVLSSTPISAEFGTNTEIEIDFAQIKTGRCVDKIEKSRYNIKVLQKTTKCAATSPWWLTTVLPQQRDIEPLHGVFRALLVKVGLAHGWCAYYHSQRQSVQNYLIMLKTQSSAPLGPEPSSLNTAYAESRAISAAVLGLPQPPAL